MVDRILIVGHGSIGKLHLKLARRFYPNSKIAVMRHKKCDDIPEYANDCISSIDEALRFSPQIAVIANPAPFHLDIAMPLASSGVHLLIEKPISNTSVNIDTLRNMRDKQGNIVLVGYNLRFLPSLKEFRNKIQQGIVGKVHSVRCEIGQYLPSWRPGSDYRVSVSGRQELGGGVLLELSHELDYLGWIFGEIEWVRAHVSKQSDLDINVEDSANLILGFCKKDQLVAKLNMDFLRHDTTRICTAIGELGSLRWNGITGTVEHFNQGDDAWSQIFKYQHVRDHSYTAEWKNFMKSIDEGNDIQATIEDGERVVQIVEAALLSSKSDRSINIKTKNPRVLPCQ